MPELAHPRVLTRIDGPLDDTVPARRPITVEDLLTFRMGAGLIIGPEVPPYPIVRAGEEAGLTLARPDPRTPHHPDEWQYNTASLVLGVLVARAAGRPLDVVLAERVLAPLGMVDTGFHLPADQAHRLPPCFLGDPVTGRPTEITSSGADIWTRPPVFPSGAGGLLSTADDFLAFARLLSRGGVHRGERLLSERSVAALTTNHLTPAQIAGGGMVLSGQGWGYGMASRSGPTRSATSRGGTAGRAGTAPPGSTTPTRISSRSASPRSATSCGTEASRSSASSRTDIPDAGSDRAATTVSGWPAHVRCICDVCRGRQSQTG